MILDDQELEKLLKEGENFRVEFKEELSQGVLRDIRRAICAFANDLPGSRLPGVLFVGVNDRGQPIDLEIQMS